MVAPDSHRRCTVTHIAVHTAVSGDHLKAVALGLVQAGTGQAWAVHHLTYGGDHPEAKKNLR